MIGFARLFFSHFLCEACVCVRGPTCSLGFSACHEPTDRCEAEDERGTRSLLAFNPNSANYSGSHFNYIRQDFSRLLRVRGHFSSRRAFCCCRQSLSALSHYGIPLALSSNILSCFVNFSPSLSGPSARVFVFVSLRHFHFRSLAPRDCSYFSNLTSIVPVCAVMPLWQR